jgi:cell wall-associated NlpC family hydrolase
MALPAIAARVAVVVGDKVAQKAPGGRGGLVAVLVVTFVFAQIVQLSLVASLLGFLSGGTAAAAQCVSTFTPVSGGGIASIPPLAFDAYQRASQATGVDWTYIAAIGSVESNHGRGEYLVNGDTAQKIIGPILDGSGAGGNITPIFDTDNGEWDGNTRYDAAVGPMQFLPGTWKGYASDGNLDGNTNAHNMFDAALGTGKYLKAWGAPENMDKAIFGYNRSDSYVAKVKSIAATYAAEAGGNDVGLPVAPNPLSTPISNPTTTGTATPNALFIVGDQLTAQIAPQLTEAALGQTPAIATKTGLTAATTPEFLTGNKKASAARTWIVGVGTFDSPDAKTFANSIRDVMVSSGGRRVFWVNISRTGYEDHNKALIAAMAKYPTLRIGDWAQLVATTPTLVTKGGLALSPTGINERAELYADLADADQVNLGQYGDQCGEGAAGALPAGAVGQIIAFAQAQLGKPYVFGSNGPDTWDCSSLTQASYRAGGVTIPRTAATQFKAGKFVPPEQVQPGDLIMFNTDPNRTPIGHVGLVIDPVNKLMIHAPNSTTVVKIESYASSYYAPRTLGFRRFDVPDATTTTTNSFAVPNVIAPA